MKVSLFSYKESLIDLLTCDTLYNTSLNEVEEIIFHLQLLSILENVKYFS